MIDVVKRAWTNNYQDLDCITTSKHDIDPLKDTKLIVFIVGGISKTEVAMLQ